MYCIWFQRCKNQSAKAERCTDFGDKLNQKNVQVCGVCVTEAGIFIQTTRITKQFYEKCSVLAIKQICLCFSLLLIGVNNQILFPYSCTICGAHELIGYAFALYFFKCDRMSVEHEHIYINARIKCDFENPNRMVKCASYSTAVNHSVEINFIEF